MFGMGRSESMHIHVHTFLGAVYYKLSQVRKQHVCVVQVPTYTYVYQALH